METKIYFIVISLCLMSHVVALLNGTSPKWKPPRDASTMLSVRTHAAGESIVLACPAEGDPKPKINWYKNGYELGLNDRIKKKGWNLNIEELQQTVDEGQYTCVVSNDFGSLNFTTHLAVEVRLLPQRPVITSDVTNQTVYEGATVTLQCRSLSSILPVWRWYKWFNETVAILLQQSGWPNVIDPAQFVLYNVTQQDSGHYGCQVINDFGVNHRDVWIAVLPTTPLPALTIIREFSIHWLVIVIIIGLICLMLVVSAFACKQRRDRLQKIKSKKTAVSVENRLYHGGAKEDLNLLIPYDENIEFPRSKLRLGELLGEGAFGKVVKGFAEGLCGKLEEPITVAVKMPKDDVTENDVKDMVCELEMMKSIGNHPNIVTFYGCCTIEGPLFLLVEFAANGNLRHFLYNHRPDQLKTSDYLLPSINGTIPSMPKVTLTCAHLISFCYQVAKGMDYIASKNIVHRDLAARNILVTENLVLKISDFGLTRDIGDAEYYKKTTRGLLPVKWMAPEALLDRKYTTKSDVWSYGILLWEIFTFGGTPYPSIPVEHLHKLLCDGHRMECPPYADEEIYTIMRSCWHFLPCDRPNFIDLVIVFDRILSFTAHHDYLNLEVSTNNIVEEGDNDVFEDAWTEKFEVNIKNRSDSQYSSLSSYPNVDRLSLDDSCFNLNIPDSASLPQKQDYVQKLTKDIAYIDSDICAYKKNIEAYSTVTFGRAREDSCLPPSFTDSESFINEDVSLSN